jgi:hypothetical protein
MKITKEWFRQYGRLDHSIHDGGYKFELITNSCVFRCNQIVTTKDLALQYLFGVVKRELWMECCRVDRYSK